MSKKNNTPKLAVPWDWIMFILTFVFVAWFANLFLVLFIYNGIPEDAGQFGDIFGAVNSVFTGITLLLLAYTVYQQHQAFLLQHREFDLLWKENVEQTSQFKAQADNYQRQLDIVQKQLEIANYRFLAENMEQAPYLVVLRNYARRTDEVSMQFEFLFRNLGLSSKITNVRTLAGATATCEKEGEILATGKEFSVIVDDSIIDENHMCIIEIEFAVKRRHGIYPLIDRWQMDHGYDEEGAIWSKASRYLG